MDVHWPNKYSSQHNHPGLCRTTFLAIRRIASVRPFLSNSSIEKLVAAMITSRLDYCNAIFAGVAMNKLRTYKTTLLAHLEKFKA